MFDSSSGLSSHSLERGSNLPRAETGPGPGPSPNSMGS